MIRTSVGGVKLVTIAAIATMWLRSLCPLPAHSDPNVLNALYLASGYHFVETSGEQLYINVCRGCHMVDERGVSAAASYPSLVANRNLGASFYVIDVVLNGRRGMPSFGEMMNDDQIAAVVNYVRTHLGNSHLDAATTSDVQAARR
ncbi:mono/diheme cytochrome c family protein [Bradyrhizobium sp. LB7.2]